jgi:hypothetical protein
MNPDENMRRAPDRRARRIVGMEIDQDFRFAQAIVGP